MSGMWIKAAILAGIIAFPVQAMAKAGSGHGDTFVSKARVTVSYDGNKRDQRRNYRADQRDRGHNKAYSVHSNKKKAARAYNKAYNKGYRHGVRDTRKVKRSALSYIHSHKPRWVAQHYRSGPRGWYPCCTYRR